MVTAMISAPCRSASQGIAIELSSPPEYARTMRVQPARREAGHRGVLEPLDERGGGPGAARDHQDGVVARDGADRLGEPGAVERLGQRLRLAASGPNHHQLLDALDVAHEFRGGALEGAERGLGVGRVGAGALIGAVPGALDQAEIGDVARNRRLRGFEAALTEAAAQQLLAVEPFAIDQLEDDGLAARFHGGRSMSIHRFLLIQTAAMCITILSDAYSCAAPCSRRRTGERAGGAGRGRRRHRLHRPGTAAPALAPSRSGADRGDVVGPDRRVVAAAARR